MNTDRRGLFRAGAVAGAGFWLMGISSFQALFVPSKKLWEYWIEHDPYSETTIDHGPWSRLLLRYLSVGADGVNRFGYAAVSSSDRQALSTYVEGLASVPIRRYRKEEQLAYWINLYNAATVDVVLAHYPVDSIRDIDISPGLFGVGPWGKTLFTIEGEEVRLNDIEHRILRPIWPDPRLHYALNCAAVGCPNLQPTAFSPDRMEEMLESAAYAFINSPRAVWWGGERLSVSSLYAWYQEDFGGDDAGILSHLRHYAEPGLHQRLAEVTRIDDHDYDWALNGTERSKS
jgi:hypothetical protein